jgi:hypothetical protein
MTNYLMIYVNSNYQTVKWYYEKFTLQIDLPNVPNLIMSTLNKNTSIFKYLLSISKIIFHKINLRKYFLYCV